MKQHLIYCGLMANNGLSEEETRKLVNDLAMVHFPNGHTIHEAVGRWAGVMVQCNENTMIVEVWEMAGFDAPPLARFIKAYKEQAAQESVVLLTREVEVLVC